MPSPSFRPGTLDEAQRLSGLCRASVRAIQEGQPKDRVEHWASMLTPERLQTILASHWTVVAHPKDGAEPVGLASLDRDVLAMLYVHPDRQGEGLARALLREVASEALRRDIRLLRVDASLNALAAYRRWGFVDHGGREKVDTAGVSYRVHRMHALVARLR